MPARAGLTCRCIAEKQETVFGSRIELAEFAGFAFTGLKISGVAGHRANRCCGEQVFRSDFHGALGGLKRLGHVTKDGAAR